MSQIYPVRVFDKAGRLVREISAAELSRRNWRRFKKANPWARLEASLKISRLRNKMRKQQVSSWWSGDDFAMEE